MTLHMVTVTGHLTEPDNLTPLQGTVTFSPGGGVLVDPADGRILAGPVTVTLDANGTFSISLPATDNTGIQPAANTWNWYAAFRLADTTLAGFNFALPTSPSTVDLSAVIQVASLTGNYLVVPGPAGTNGTNGHTPALYGGAAVPSTLHTDGDLYLRTNGDLYQQTAGAWGSPVGNIQGPAGSGGAAVRTAKVRITDDNLTGLPSAPSWAVVTTSGGTPLQCTIAAAVGDRIESSPNFMHIGAHFLDWAILTSAGAIDRYASTETTSPGPEGAPEEYPSLTFEYVNSTEQFTVQSGNLNGGSVTIALVHQGAATGNANIVYAHPTYPWRLRLKNLGPEPA